MDVEVEIKRLTDNLLVARITGCSSLEIFHSIMSKIVNYVNVCLQDKLSVSKSVEQKGVEVDVEMSTVVLPEKRKVFTDHDAAEFGSSDVDEFSDYDEEDEEEEELSVNQMRN